MDWSDKRPLTDLAFGILETDEARRTETARFVREKLSMCGVEIADDIIDVGCTGLAKQGISIEDAKRIRLGLGGSGVGLTCFVGPDRYCLVHETVGGLQDGQQQLHPAYVLEVSRDLEPGERDHVAVIENIRRRDPQKPTRDRIMEAASALTNASPDAVIEDDEEPEAEASPSEPASTADRCPEHGKVYWNCRFCVAALIVNGGFDLDSYVVDPDPEEAPDEAAPPPYDPPMETCSAADVKYRAGNTDTDFDVYVRVAKFRRRLVME